MEPIESVDHLVVYASHNEEHNTTFLELPTIPSFLFHHNCTPSNLTDNVTCNFTEVSSGNLLLGYSAMPVLILLLLTFFFILFTVGFVGNLTVIIRIIRTHRQFIRMYGRDDSRRMRIQRYVLLLACVDLFVTVQIPMLFPYFYSGQWLIGEMLCKLFFIVENVNKIISIHILTAMAIERYFIVLHSIRTECSRRRLIPRVATTTVFAVTVISLLLLTPLLSYVQIDVTKIDGVQITTCVSPMSDNVYILFIVYTFILSFCLPAIIITVCYVRLVHILKVRYKLTNMNENSKAQLVQKVTKSIMCVTGFHFVCWTPFWAMTFLPILAAKFHKQFMVQTTPVLILTVMLPYVNCSFNWCFYVLLNQRLRKQIFRSSSVYNSLPR